MADPLGEVTAKVVAANRGGIDTEIVSASTRPGVEGARERKGSELSDEPIYRSDSAHGMIPRVPKGITPSS